MRAGIGRLLSIPPGRRCLPSRPFWFRLLLLSLLSLLLLRPLFGRGLNLHASERQSPLLAPRLLLGRRAEESGICPALQSIAHPEWPPRLPAHRWPAADLHAPRSRPARDQRPR